MYADGGVYALAFDGVHALPPDGSERWHRSLGGAPSNSVLSTGHPVVVDGTVFAPTASTASRTDAVEGLSALDTGAGDERWRYEVPTDERGWTFAPAYADGTVYCSVLDDGVVAPDAASGDSVGFVANRYGSGTTGSVAVSDGLAFTTTSAGTPEAVETCAAGVDGHCPR